MEVSFQQWFDNLYMQNSLKMVQTARRLLGSSESAEDVVQNVFIILLAKKDQVMVHPCPQAWLFVTLRNQIGNELQRQRHRNTDSLDDGYEIGQEDNYEFPFCDCLPPGLTNSEREILSMEKSRCNCSERKSLTASRICSASCLEPMTPIRKSSAYRQY